MDTESLVTDVFAQFGIEVLSPSDPPDRGVDLIVDPEGVRTPVEIKYRSLVSDDIARRLLGAARADRLLLVVGDRVTESARKLLTGQGTGYYDLRGRIVVRAKDLVIDAEVEPVGGRRAGRTKALTGKAGTEVATALLLQPARRVTVRDLARTLGRSASTVSEVLAILRRDGLVDAENTVIDTRLFWLVVDSWSTPTRYLANLPAPDDASIRNALRLGLDDVEGAAGWALTDSAAAAAYGAPLAVRAGQTLEFYVPDASVTRRAENLLGGAVAASLAKVAVKVAPVPAVVQKRVDLATTSVPWPLAHPLFVALDLAQDIGRGREILDAWTPDDRWTRVW